MMPMYGIESFKQNGGLLSMRPRRLAVLSSWIGWDSLNLCSDKFLHPDSSHACMMPATECLKLLIKHLLTMWSFKSQQEQFLLSIHRYLICVQFGQPYDRNNLRESLEYWGSPSGVTCSTSRCTWSTQFMTINQCRHSKKSLGESLRWPDIPTSRTAVMFIHFLVKVTRSCQWPNSGYCLFYAKTSWGLPVAPKE